MTEQLDQVLLEQEQQGTEEDNVIEEPLEFVEVLGTDKLRMRVWERGSGVTMACGTGACASVMAAIAAKLFHYDETVSVMLDGGTLKIQIAPDNTVQMTGPAETVYEGETEIC